VEQSGMSHEVQMHTSARRVGRMQEAEPGNNWQLGACKLEAVGHNVSMLNNTTQMHNTLTYA